MGVWIYHVIVFLGAFLLFLIQPILSKAILPGFGGSYLVWGASMVFYQGMLLLGYLGGHFFQRWLGVVRYARWHWVCLLAPFVFCPFDFDRLGEASPSLPLAVGVFLLLLTAVSLPFLALSMTSLVLQRWLAASSQRTNPYVLYSASNLGSLSALLLYPTAIEPLSSLEQQGLGWWCGYALFVLLHSFCLPGRTGAETGDAEEARASVRGVSGSECVRWLLLSMAACAMLLAVTNVMTLDVASIPFLWILPLVVYLLAFVVTFKNRMWCPGWMQKGIYWCTIVAVMLHLCSQLRLSPPVAVAIVAHLVILFVVCVNCCAALVRTKPQDPSELTTFYVVIAVGGLLGSLIVSWIVPLVSSVLIEYMLSLAIVFAAMGSTKRVGFHGRGGAWVGSGICGLLMISSLTVLPGVLGRWLPANILLILIALPVALLLRYRSGAPWRTAWLLLLLVMATPWVEQLAVRAKGVERLRNYYGIYKIYDRDGLRYLQHGTTQHGRQYLAGPKRNVPLAYFHPTTPAAGVLQSDAFECRNIGMIGLGTGALVAYAGSNQTFTIYEIDRDNGRIAEESFDYLAQARKQGADVQHVFGDGRVSLRSRQDATLDVMILDAFSSGAIPVHLLTTQALEEYLRVLKPDGVVLMHVSNKMLDLLPVIYSNAKALDAMVCESTNAGKCHPDAETTYWAALTRDPVSFNVLVTQLGWWTRSTESLPAPWTDRYSNVLGAVVW